MRTFLTTDRLHLLLVLLCLATVSWSGVAAAALLVLVVACRRAARTRLATWGAPQAVRASGPRGPVASAPALPR